MLSKKEVNEIKAYINKSENPLIFFDDDPDGLCSYLLLAKFYEKGKGVVVKGKPTLDIEFLRKVEEYSPDLVIILDKPIVSQEFIDSINVPIIWIDHHPAVKRKGVHYYNPKIKAPDVESPPTTALVYQITKSDLWIATIGSVADWTVQKFVKDFQKLYPDLLPKTKDTEHILFETKLGELIRIFSFLLKGKTSDVNKCISILKKINDPREIINQESSRGKFLFKKAEKISRLYESLLEKAIKYSEKGKILLFIYPSSNISFTSDLSNELIHKYPDKIVIIGREKDDEIRMSIRSSKEKLPPLIEKALENVKGYGGGHDLACGANVAKDDFKTFIENFKNLLK